MATITQTTTIRATLDEFLREQEERLSPATFANYADVVWLLESCLNGYGHEWLDADESERFERVFEAGDEEAFCNLFGPEKIPEQVGSFLNWFMLRKVFAGQQLLKASTTVSKRLLTWLCDRGLIDAVAAAEAKAIAVAAAHDLPASDRLTRLLGELCSGTPFAPLSERVEDEVVEDMLTITRVEPGRLWFDDGIGPLEVPHEASDLAKPGWSLFAALASVKGHWRLLEHGVVYP